MSQLLKSVLNKGSMAPPPVPGRRVDPADYAQGRWEDYFSARREVTIDNGDKFCVYFAGDEGPVVLLLHGAGYSALSWALMTKRLVEACTCRVVAYDCRGHGSTTTSDDSDLAAATLANDCVRLVGHLFPDHPPVILVGHSMGGAIAVQSAAKGIPGLVGLCVVDVVEGTALAALSSMQTILGRRPKSFPSVEDAIAWTLRSGTVKNREAAAISVPAQFVPAEDGGVVWRTDLAASEVHWEGWFKNLSKNFLAVPVNKMLLLAGTDRLDKELTIAQMMGKFALKMLPAVGHVIQEDDPDGTANSLCEYLTRNRWATAK